ncbi:response regulator [Jeotgalibacillus salarius]|uniref:Response regulator transcription factor n=1 Tax=Jeotgalibacillus salarius TaxID=546023 RepID=A0A4Y8LE30_9BACL|nr:response regulator [Jeotgalibacillus salarius]TFD99748.1 response regulator transcription factor [Jeotgalibacillus salarius]
MQRIMIIEDNADLRLDLSEQVSDLGYQSIPVTDFERIIEHFIEEKPDLVLLDVKLPFFDGYYWYRQIREYSKCPIVYLWHLEDTTRGLQLAREGRKTTGDVLPLTSEMLRTTLTQHLKNRMNNK